MAALRTLAGIGESLAACGRFQRGQKPCSVDARVHTRAGNANPSDDVREPQAHPATEAREQVLRGAVSVPGAVHGLGPVGVPELARETIKRAPGRERLERPGPRV